MRSSSRAPVAQASNSPISVVSNPTRAARRVAPPPVAPRRWGRSDSTSRATRSMASAGASSNRSGSGPRRIASLVRLAPTSAPIRVCWFEGFTRSFGRLHSRPGWCEMYTEFYGLREKPFSLTPDPRFLYLSASHREALAHVLYGIEQGEGFISVTGEVGTGKTTLCWTLLERLGPDTEVAFLFNPMLSGEELVRAVSAEFGLASEGLSRTQLNDQLNRFLLEQRRAGRRVLLIIDEAQNLSPQTLEEIRLLSNLETSTSKLLQILLFGQPELDAKLESRELRQLRQRISVRWALQALDAGETGEYVRHRIRTAAAGHVGELFTETALRDVHRRSGGVPRLVNLVCDRALLAGYAAGMAQVGPDLVADAARELLARRHKNRQLAEPWPRGRAIIAAAALASLVIAGAIAWQRLGARGAEPTAPAAAVAAPASAPAVPLPGSPGARAEAEPLGSLSAGTGEAG